MNLRDEILREHSKDQAVKLAEYIGDDPLRFKELMELFLGEDYRISQRASWVVGHCFDRHPELVKPWLPKMVDAMSHPRHDAVRRNVVRILQEVDIPESLMGTVADNCFEYLNSPEIPVAIRAFSMTVLYRISLQWPELQRELALVIEEHMPTGSAGFKSRGKKILKLLDR